VSVRVVGRKRLSAVMAVVAITCPIIATPQAATAAKPECFGEKATIVAKKGQKVVRGTKKPDVIVGTNKKNVVKAKGGDDLICGFGGRDKIRGQKGSDAIDGGGGGDDLKGGGGEDFAAGNHGTDSVNGGPGNDFVEGNGGNDALVGGGGIFDTASFETASAGVTVNLTAGTATGEGTDTLAGISDVIGSNFNDSLTGDAIESGNGFYPGGGEDTVDGGGGPFDIFIPLTVEAVTIDLTAGIATSAGEGTDTLVDIEDAYGTDAADVMTGSAGPNFFVGFQGDDQLAGLAGDDFLDGDAGEDVDALSNDTLDGGDDNDTCINGETLANCESTTPPGRAAAHRLRAYLLR
jgi:Ca2+-binding RTX toxin-like protein